MSPEEIKNIRLKLGLTQLEFSLLIDRNPTTISLWETGKQKPTGKILLFKGFKRIPHHQIKDFRLRLGLTQHQFADLIGCQPGTISLWETGKHEPNRAFIKSIERVYRIQSKKLNVFRSAFKERF